MVWLHARWATGQIARYASQHDNKKGHKYKMLYLIKFRAGKATPSL